MSISSKLINFVTSIWFFPIVLTIILFLFTGLKISGSSLEIYNYILGEQQSSSLLVNQPKAVRSDEWLVATEMTVAQNSNHYREVNKNIGNGQNMSFTEDVPYKDWSTIFKPENWAFFVIPFSHAFAFKWWVMAYLLVLSCYFFVLEILPGKKVLAILLSITLLFTPFIQWWYQFDTLAPIYYSFIMATLFIKIMRARTKKVRALFAACLGYVATAFVLILYPPFMISCAIALAGFCIGFMLEQKKTKTWRDILEVVGWVGLSLIFAALIVLLFIETRYGAYKILNDTVYPGNRSAPGGGYDVTKIFGGFMNTQLQNTVKATTYGLNQSENSNFILLSPFLFLPSIFLLIKDYRRKKVIDWPLLSINVAVILLFIRELTPALDPIFKIFLLYKVPARRLLIGIGFAGILQLIFFIRNISRLNIKKYRLWIAAYSFLVLAVETIVVLETHHRFFGYISYTKGLVLAFIVALIVFLILNKRFLLGLSLLTLLCFYSTSTVMPLYVGTAPLTATPLSTAIRNIAATSNGKWIAETIEFENFAVMNGAHSLSGVYEYPQTAIWKNVPPDNADIYNRYAHVIYVVDHTGTANFTTHLVKVQDDTFIVLTEPCSAFLEKNNVRYILAQSPIDNKCLSLVQEVPYPSQIFFIYRINYP